MTKGDKVLVILFRYLLGIAQDVQGLACAGRYNLGFRLHRDHSFYRADQHHASDQLNRRASLPR